MDGKESMCDGVAYPFAAAQRISTSLYCRGTDRSATEPESSAEAWFRTGMY